MKISSRFYKILKNFNEFEKKNFNKILMNLGKNFKNFKKIYKILKIFIKF
jgi:hypothetical protein